MFGKKIKLIRQILDLTQAEFALRLGISSPALSRIESDMTSPSAETTAKLIHTFNVNLNWLYNDYGPPFNTSEEEDIAREDADKPYNSADLRELRNYRLLLKLSETQEKLIEQIEENSRLRRQYRKRLQQLQHKLGDSKEVKSLMLDALSEFVVGEDE